MLALALVAGGVGAQTGRERADLERERAALEQKLAELRAQQMELQKRLADRQAHEEAQRDEAADKYREAQRVLQQSLEKDAKQAQDRYRKLADLRLQRGLKGLQLDPERSKRVQELTRDYLTGWAGLSAEIRKRAQELKGRLGEEGGGREDAIRSLVDRIYGVDEERNLLESRCRSEIRKLLEPREEARFLLGILDFDMDLKRGLEAFRGGESGKAGGGAKARDLMEKLEELSKHAKDSLESPETRAHLDELRASLNEAMAQAHKIHEEEMVRVKAALEELARQKQPLMEELERRTVELRDMMEDLHRRLEEAGRAIEKAMKERAREEGGSTRREPA
jgi:hypothetical protein